MDKKGRFPIRRYSSLDEMKADEYEYWQGRPVHERMTAVSEISAESYELKGHCIDVHHFQRTLVHLKR